MGLVLSAGFATATTVVADDYEHILVESLLSSQADAYFDAIAIDPNAALPRSPALGIYERPEAPAMYRDLAPGVHEPGPPTPEGVHVGVFERGGRRLIFVLDVGHIETLERYLEVMMLFVVVAGCALSGWMGWFLAARAIRPVSRLAKAVDHLPLRPIPTSFSSNYGADELGSLARAIDSYQLRLAEAESAERQFFADASHELRTPIAVIQGAVEILQDDPATSASQRIRLARIDRSIFDLASLLEALLLSARGLGEDREDVALGELCLHAIDRLAVSDPGIRERIEFVGVGPVVRAPRRWVTSIVNVLVQRIASVAPESKWQFELTESGLTISQPLVGGSIPLVANSDLGLGMVFIERLARKLGWSLVQHSSIDGGFSVRLTIDGHS